MAKIVRLITINDDPFNEVNDPFSEKEMKRLIIQKAQVQSQVHLPQIFCIINFLEGLLVNCFL